MKKKIIVFILSVILAVIGIWAMIVYMNGNAPAGDAFDFLPFLDNSVINSMGVVAVLFSATALVLTVYCIKFCSGVLRTLSIILCVLCVLSIVLTIIGAVLYFTQASKNLTDAVLVRL